MPDQFPIVALNDDVGTRFLEQGCVVRDGIEGFDFVSPPVSERTATGSVFGDFRGDFVSLKHVLKRLDTDAMILGDSQQHQDFIGSVTV